MRNFRNFCRVIMSAWHPLEAMQHFEVSCATFGEVRDRIE
jgi:hypothetical protein